MLIHHTQKDEVSQSTTKRIRALSVGQHTSENEDAHSGRYLVYKKRGETLAVMLRRVREEEDIPETVPITYAGRLDPMAEGVVLLLVGEARYQKDEYLTYAKTYEVEILCGLSTDTHDMLGCIIGESFVPISKDVIREVVGQMRGITELPYPMYSSVLVQGTPLFVHARAGTDVVIPTKALTITEAVLLHVRTAPVEALVREAIVDICLVEGDFRQLPVMKQWQQYIQTHSGVLATVATIRVTATSGTYMRSLAVWMGEKLGTVALAYRIKRTKIGDYSI